MARVRRRPPRPTAGSPSGVRTVLAVALAGATAAGLADDVVVPARTAISRSTGMTLVLVREGEYALGSPATERERLPDEPPRRVTITRPFYLGAFEVTQDEYAKVMDRRPSAFAADAEAAERVVGMATGRHPVENVSWYDAVEFCNRLGERDGFAPAFRLDGAVRRADGSLERAEVTLLGGDGYRLPTEAEWECACRAGTTTPFHYGAVTRREDANCKPVTVEGLYGAVQPWRELGRTAAAGSYPANAWGLHEMHGNVAEWCWDWYGEQPGPGADPTGPPRGTHKVVRGGSWLITGARCRSASRFADAPADRSYDTGFRVARTPR